MATNSVVATQPTERVLLARSKIVEFSFLFIRDSSIAIPVGYGSNAWRLIFLLSRSRSLTDPLP